MSRQAIAAALAREDLSSGERLVAFSLASFADRESRARPGTPAAAWRAGLRKSWFLEARDALERRGLVVVEQAAVGRGRASVLWLPLAEQGPWLEGDINAELFEAVLSYSRASGSARLLLAAAAALADEQRTVRGVTTERLCAAAGVKDRTYRRARIALLASGELVLRRGTGGRGNTNCWEIADPRSLAGEVPAASRRRVAPPAAQRPLVASVSATPAAAVEHRTAAAVEQPGAEGEAQLLALVRGGAERTDPDQSRPVGAGVSIAKAGADDRTLSPGDGPVGAGVSLVKGGAERTLSPQTPAETPAQTPAKTPAPYARAGREPQNPRTVPPQPPEGGSATDSIVIEETFVTDRGRRRPRRRTVDLAPIRERLRAAGDEDGVAWQAICRLLLEAVGESQYEIWLGPLELLAVNRDGVLMVSAPAATASWVRERFGWLIARCAESVGRELRLADEAERAAAGTLAAGSGTPAAIATIPTPSANKSPDRSPGRLSGFADAGVSGQRAARSADSSACPQARNQRREAR
jgi:hypothetical protein